MNDFLKILYLEDDPADFNLTQAILEEEELQCRIERASDEKEFSEKLAEQKFDLILSDYSLPDFDGISAMKMVRKKFQDLPFIMLSGALGEELAIETLKSGATDYVLKTRMSALVPAIRRAVHQKEDRTMRKQAEKELKMSEQKFRSLFNNLTDAVYIHDLGSRFLEINDAACKMLGYSRDEFLEMTPRDISSEENKKKIKKRLNHILNHGSHLFETVHIAKSGKAIPVEVSSTIISYMDKKAILSEVRDISERIEARHALKESEERFRGLYENALVGLYRTTPDGEIQMANPALVKMLGYSSEEELKQRNLEKEGYDPDYSREKFKHILEVKDSIVGLESAWKTKDGRIIYVLESARAVRDESGEIRYYEGTVLDITDKKYAQQERDRLAALVNQASEAIILTDPDGNIEYVNLAYEKATGYSRDEVLGKNPKIVKSGKHNLEFYKNLWDTIKSGKTWQGEFINRKKDGTLYYEDSFIFPIKNDKDEIINFAAVKKDITSQKQLEQQFYRAQRMESVGTLAAGIAHDLNNILSPIMMGVQILKKQDQNEKPKKYLDAIEVSAKRGADLVKQVLTFARGVEGAQIHLNPKHLIKEIQQIIKEAFPKNIELYVDIPKDVRMIKADPTQIHQVLMNLCVNAKDAMPDGGKLSITTENEDVDKSIAKMHSLPKPGTYVKINVSDNGIGIPKDVQEKIFEPFFTTKEMGKGTGLGLSTTLSIVKSHGGFIDVRSEPNKGTTFNIYLPAVVSPVLQKKEIQQHTAPQGNGEHILLVDDESSLLEISKEILESHGYRVTTTCDGTEAVATYADKNNRNIDAVITDMVMPNMDGMMTIQVLRKINPEVKIIAVSGFSEKMNKKSLEEHQVYHYLNKPYTGNQLLEKVARLFNGKDKDGNNSYVMTGNKK